jgi:molybdate transport system ATP-binding protein
VSLLVDVAHRRGGFALEARFEAPAGVTAIFGHSGAGKTTLLDLIAGLERPDRGRIELDGQVLTDTQAGTWVPSARRRIGYVFQDSRLFPHLSVRQNLEYGQRAAGLTMTDEERRRILGLLGLEGLLDRRPATLSGGEKQRVAIGRALFSEPRQLLLDEPLASLDVERRAEILPYLARLKDAAGVPIVYVSHALSEVARLADTVVLLAAGRVSAVGPVADLLSRLDLGEATQGAEAGAVLTVRVRVQEGGLFEEGTVDGDCPRRGLSPPPRRAGLSGVPPAPASAGVTVLEHPAGEFRVPWQGLTPGTALRLHVLARDVAIATGEVGALSIRNRLAATIVELGPKHGGMREIRLDAGGEALLARVTAEAAEEMSLRPGLPVTALIKSVALER